MQVGFAQGAPVLVPGGTGSHSCDMRPKHKLLLVTDIQVHASRLRVPERWLRLYGGLERHFDATWSLALGSVTEGDQSIPGEFRLVFVPSARSKWHFFALWPRYLKILAGAMRGTDIVLVPGPTLSAVPALVAARLRRQPSILLVVAPTQELPWFRRRSNRWMVPLVDNLTVLLATETLLINSHLGEGIWSPLRERLSAIRYSSLGKEDFLPIEAPPSDRPVELLCVGRLRAPKRFDIAIETVALLRRDGIEATLTIVGDGEERRRLEGLTHEFDVSDVVHFVGWVEDPVRLRELYRRAFALLLPSEIEGFPMVVLEAMAAGTPVVATGPTGGFDTLEPGVDVLVVPSSAESFVSSVNRLFTDRDFYFQIARAAQTKAQSLTRDAWQELLWQRADQMIKERRR